jgi:hypothetical protein
VPNGDQRVVLVVVGGLSAEPEYVDFVSFRKTIVGWSRDAVELSMRAQLPTNSVPNWLATVTGLTPDMIGALGNRNLGTTAYDNIYRMMGRFSEHWADHEALASPYLSVMAASPWFTGLVKTDLPYLVGDGSTSYVANEDDALDRSEIFQRSTEEQDASRFHVAHKALGDDDEKDYHFLLLHLTDVDSQARRVTPHPTASRDPAPPTPPLPHSLTPPHRISTRRARAGARRTPGTSTT